MAFGDIPCRGTGLSPDHRVLVFRLFLSGWKRASVSIPRSPQQPSLASGRAPAGGSGAVGPSTKPTRGPMGSQLDKKARGEALRISQISDAVHGIWPHGCANLKTPAQTERPPSHSQQIPAAFPIPLARVCWEREPQLEETPSRIGAVHASRVDRALGLEPWAWGSGQVRGPPELQLPHL